MFARLRNGVLCLNCYRVTQRCVFWKRSYSVELCSNSKLNQRQSFTKECFLGKFDPEIFSWLEGTSEVSLLERQLNDIDLYFRSQVRSVNIDVEEMVSKKILEDLRKFNLFGLRVPTQYGGLGLKAKDYCAFRDVISGDRSIDELLFNHEMLGLQGIVLVGSEEQKQTYLPKLVRDNWIAALAVLENDFSFHPSDIKTRATISEDGKFWKISGKKKWVVNAPLANIYTVLAITQKTGSLGEKEDVYTAFLVERDFGNIKIGEPEPKLGLSGVPVSEVTFEDTIVPHGNILGEIGSGLEPVKNIFNAARFYAAYPVPGVLRKLVNMGTKFENKRRDVTLVRDDFKINQWKLVEATCVTYTMESMCYMTAAVMDSQQFADDGIESAIMKIFSVENLWQTLHSLQDLFGSKSFDERFPFERIFRDAYTTLMPDESTDRLKLWIALAGLQHAGLQLQSKVGKIRNLLDNPTYLFNLINNTGLKKPSAGKSNAASLELDSHLHKSLRECAKQLESCIIILKTVSELLLTEYGAEIVDHELLLIKLADIAVCIYAMTAVLGRASYSLNNALENSDFEISIVEIICSSAVKKVQTLETEIQKVYSDTFDGAYRKIADKLFFHKEYFVSHPLDRNF